MSLAVARSFTWKMNTGVQTKFSWFTKSFSPLLLQCTIFCYCTKCFYPAYHRDKEASLWPRRPCACLPTQLWMDSKKLLFTFKALHQNIFHMYWPGVCPFPITEISGGSPWWFHLVTKGWLSVCNYRATHITELAAHWADRLSLMASSKSLLKTFLFVKAFTFALQILLFFYWHDLILAYVPLFLSFLICTYFIKMKCPKNKDYY